MLTMAGTPDAMGTRDASGRPQLSAAAGAKSREKCGQEIPRAALKRKHGSTRPFGRTRDDYSESPARLARREAKSESARVRAHHGLVLATTPSRVNLWMSAWVKIRLFRQRSGMSDHPESGPSSGNQDQSQTCQIRSYGCGALNRKRSRQRPTGGTNPASPSRASNPQSPPCAPKP